MYHYGHLNGKHCFSQLKYSRPLLDTLLAAGVSISATDSNGNNGLMTALQTNNLAKAYWFIRHGVDLNQKKFSWSNCC